MDLKETDILKNIQEFFSIWEFVGPKTYKKHRNRSWKFFSFRLLHTMYILRKHIDKPITVNDWYWGGIYSQRGLRTNLQQIFKNAFKRALLYLSGHVLGMAVDFQVEGMTAKEVRKWIVDNQHLFPYKIRLELTNNGKEITWIHLDVIFEEKNPHIYLFAA